MKRCIPLLLLLLSIQASAQMNYGKLITKKQYLEIPFTETKKSITTQASLKGEVYDFLLDSGAPMFISKEVQDKNKYPVLFHIMIKDAGGQDVPADIVAIDTVRFGPFIFTGLCAFVIDIHDNMLECEHITGNLGSNALRYLFVQFDLNDHKIAFTDDKTLLKKQLTGNQPMHLDMQSNAFLHVKLDNSMTDTLHFDSGDGTLYQISKNAAEKYIKLFPANVVRSGFGILGMGIGGEGDFFQQYTMKPKSMGIGNSSISGGTVIIAGNNISRMGRELLNYGILQLNYPDSTYSFTAYTPAYNGNNYDYGFKSMMDDNNNAIIGCVWDKTEAQEKGMASGDRIIKINNTDFTVLSKCDVAAALRKELLQNSDRITITYQHKKHKPETITLNKMSL